MSNKHSAILTDNDGRPVAFVDGIQDKCEHQWDGELLHFNDAGEYFRDGEIPGIEFDYGRLLHQFYTDHRICGACVSCSKCGKLFEPEIW